MDSTLKKIMANDADANDNFGHAVSLSGNMAAVGAPSEGHQSGATYLFEQSEDGNWQQVDKVTADDREDGDSLGHAVSLDGNLVAVGAPNEGSNRGAVYVFERQENNRWQQIRKLLADDREPDNFFGSSVSVHGNMVMVGAYGEGDKSGAVYMFERQSETKWQETKLTASDREPNSGFGWSVSLDGSVAIVGAALKNSETAGAAYLFERNDEGDWEQVDKVEANDERAGNNFGHSVSLNAGIAIVGTHGQFGDGMAYIYERDGGTWTQKQVLQACDRRRGDGFSYSVSLNGNVAAVGAPLQDTNNNRNGGGAAYIFQRLSNGIWVEVQKVVISDPEQDDRFGASVSLDGDLLIAGTPGRDNVDKDAGAAYITEYKQETGAGSSGDETKLTCGSTPAGDTAWQDNGENVIFVEIDTSAAGFNETPKYFTSLGGVEHSFADGITTIANASQDGFRLTIQASDITAEKANTKQWHVNWFAVGSDGAIPYNMDEDSDGTAFKIGSGATEAGNTNWEDSGVGITLVVDTSALGFTKTPKYFTALAGENAPVKGTNALYNVSATQFQIQINHHLAEPLTPEQANERNWHLYWFAVDSGSSKADVTVEGTASWFDTGVNVKQGERLTITASGEWKNNVEGEFASGPYGFNLQGFMPLPTANLASLIGRIGAEGELFFVGGSFSEVRSDAGRLFLQMNDEVVSDNAGQLEVSIEAG